MELTLTMLLVHAVQEAAGQEVWSCGRDRGERSLCASFCCGTDTDHAVVLTGVCSTRGGSVGDGERAAP